MEKKPSKLTSEARIALASAIAERDEAARELQAATDAVTKARDLRYDAQCKLAALRTADTDIDPQSLADAFISSVAAGAAFDVTVLARPGGTKDREELEREIEIWSRTEESCKASVPVREQALCFADKRVDAAAREVIKASSSAASLLNGLAELEAEVFRRRLALCAMDHSGLIAEADRAAVDAALRNTLFSGDAKAAIYGNWNQREDFTVWKQTVEALKRDANAPLP